MYEVLFALIDNKLVCAPELVQLYELYQEEQHKLVKGDDISSFTSFDKVCIINPFTAERIYCKIGSNTIIPLLFIIFVPL